jgi:ABC-2 type transport system permease protein
MNLAAYGHHFIRFWAVLKKEFIQIKRDYITYLFLIGIPFAQVILFGNIINTNAQNLNTVVLTHDNSVFTNSLIQGFKNTGYFKIIRITQQDNETEKMLKSAKTQFIITIPNNFSQDIINNKHPHILIEGDASDPVLVGNAFNAVTTLANTVLNRDLEGILSFLKNKEPLFYVDTHSVYNPAILAQYHTLPGLITIILTVTLVMLTAISLTTEYEQGTMEMILITPCNPLEVILGKIIGYVTLGIILFLLTVSLSFWIFSVPFIGNFFLLILCTIPYLVANLGIGLTISCASRTQLRAANIANTYILPAILFSGFLFPFYAMPIWAQWIGELFPPTHYLRIILEIMLKGATFGEIWPNLWPILLFDLFIIFISLNYFRKTLD